MSHEPPTSEPLRPREPTVFDRLLCEEGTPAIERMFAELRDLVRSWGAMPEGDRPTVLQVAVVLWVFAQAIVVKRGRWP